MPRKSDSKIKHLERKDDKAPSLETTAGKDKSPLSNKIVSKKKSSHLKLVVSNPAPSQKKTDSSVRNSPRPTEGFSIELHHEGKHVYQMLAHDPSHYLECGLKLEVIEGDGYGIGVICHFRDIADEDFHEFVEGDETLYGNLMGQFHIKIMEALLLFCGDYDASGLVIYVNDDQAKQLGAYNSILVRQDKVIFKDIGEKTAMVFRANQETFDQWIEFMEDATHYFQQELWLQQKFNPVIRAYLKSQNASRQALQPDSPTVEEA